MALTVELGEHEDQNIAIGVGLDPRRLGTGKDAGLDVGRHADSPNLVPLLRLRELA